MSPSSRQIAEVLVGRPLGRDHPRAPALAAVGADGGAALTDALADELRSISANAAWICKGAAARGRGIERAIEHAEADAAAPHSSTIWISSPGASPKPVKVQHHQHVTAAEVIKARIQTGRAGVSAAAAVIEDALAAGRAVIAHASLTHGRPRSMRLADLERGCAASAAAAAAAIPSPSACDHAIEISAILSPKSRNGNSGIARP
jgi:hypothetical protein